MNGLRAAMSDAQQEGFVGPGPVEAQLGHAERLAELIERSGRPDAGPWLDLGTGGGLPGLVLALRWPTARGTLLDANARRCAFVREVVDRLGLTGRVAVVEGRAEAVARMPEHRTRYALVVARSFGSPAVTAECAVGFLSATGRLAVSEPPATVQPGESSEPGLRVEWGRWPPVELEALGLAPAGVLRGDGATVAVMARNGEALDGRWPRRSGIPQKRPLWRIDGAAPRST